MLVTCKLPKWDIIRKASPTCLMGQEIVQMLKKYFLTIFVTVVLLFSLTACSNNKNNSAANSSAEALSSNEQNVVLSESQNEGSTPELEIVNNKTYTLDDIVDEESVNPDEEFLCNAIDELAIGFSNYGIDYTIKDSSAYINHPDTDGFVNDLYASNEFLDSHEFEFIISENADIYKFTPRTLESLDLGYVEDDPDTWGSIGECFGCVWESSLEYNTGIEWTYGEKLQIVIDGKYHIYINYKDEYPEDGSEYFEIH